MFREDCPFCTLFNLNWLDGADNDLVKLQNAARTIEDILLFDYCEYPGLEVIWWQYRCHNVTHSAYETQQYLEESWRVHDERLRSK